MNNKTNKLIKISLLSAISVILMFFDFPVIPMFSWLKIDLSDVPALLGAFGFGPIAGVIIEFIKNILYMLVKGGNIVGVMANFIIGTSLILPAAYIYHKNKSKKNAILGMIVGTICMEVIGILANVYILLPLYGMSGMTASETMQYVTIGLIPFNGVKALLVNIVTYILYKRISVSVFHVESKFDAKVTKKQTC